MLTDHQKSEVLYAVSIWVKHSLHAVISHIAIFIESVLHITLFVRINKTIEEAELEVAKAGVTLRKLINHIPHRIIFDRKIE